MGIVLPWIFAMHDSGLRQFRRDPCKARHMKLFEFNCSFFLICMLYWLQSLKNKKIKTNKKKRVSVCLKLGRDLISKCTSDLPHRSVSAATTEREATVLWPCYMQPGMQNGEWKPRNPRTPKTLAREIGSEEDEKGEVFFFFWLRDGVFHRWSLLLNVWGFRPLRVF